MSMRFIKSIMVIATLAVIGAGVVDAQVTSKLQVEIPFSFVLQDRELPPGKYQLERIDPSIPNVMRLTNGDAHISRVVLAQRVQKEAPSAETYLLFRRRQRKLYLFQVWSTGAVNGIQIPLLDEPERTSQKRDSTSFVRLNIKAP